MTHLEEIHQRLVDANKYQVLTMTTFHAPLLQATHAAQTMHEVIAAIDSIYLYLKEENERTKIT